MSAVDDLTELVERVAAAEQAGLAAQWRDQEAVAAMRGKVQLALEEQRDLERRVGGTALSTARRERLRAILLDGDLGYAYASGGDATDGAASDAPAAEGSPAALVPTSHGQAIRAEADAVVAVTVARLALQEAHLAVLDARLASIAAGEAEVGGSTGGRSQQSSRNPVSRHGPALARGLRGEIDYILNRRPRSVVRSLAISLAMGLLYLGFIRVFEWDTKQRLLPYLGLFAISVVMGGAVCVNAMSFDSMRVRAALAGGTRLWQLLVVKNAALATLVAPIGFLLSALLAWRAGDLAALAKACTLIICMILLWLGVGNVLSVLLPIRDEPLLKRRRSGSLKQFLIAFAVSYGIGYLVNLMLLWRIYAARELATRLGNAAVPAILILLSSAAMWLLLTVFAVAFSQQPKVRRTLWREIADYGSAAEVRASPVDSAR